MLPPGPTSRACRPDRDARRRPAARAPRAAAALRAPSSRSARPGRRRRSPRSDRRGRGIAAIATGGRRRHSSTRRLTRPVALGGHALAAGTVVMAPSLLLHRDPAQFPDPGAFIADRFEGAAHGPFFPFGGGARACIGRHLAQAEIRNVVPVVLRATRLRPLAREAERLVERATIPTPARGALVTAGF